MQLVVYNYLILNRFFSLHAKYKYIFGAVVGYFKNVVCYPRYVSTDEISWEEKLLYKRPPWSFVDMSTEVVMSGYADVRVARLGLRNRP